ncbi:MAG: prenyltransferase [Microbacteriaceae bacterium]|nr:prenyltransferase [Microbacteriaceae bacterium]
MTAARSILVSSRPLSWVNTAFPFAAAYLVTTREVDVLFVVGTLYFLIPYNIAMYGINDVFDYESDLRNPRKGGAEGALLDPSVHRIMLLVGAIANVPFLIFLIALGRVPSTLVLAISVFAVVAYSAPRLRFKERPFLDSVTSSTHFLSPALFGLVLAGAVLTPQLVALLAAFFLWGVGSHAFGAVQDIGADRDAHIASIATVIGGRATVRLAFACYLLAGLLLLFTAFPGQLAAVLMLPYAAGVLPFWRIRDAEAERANRGWKRFLALNFVTGFLVTLLLVWYVILPTGGAGASVTCYFGSYAPAPSGGLGCPDRG